MFKYILFSSAEGLGLMVMKEAITKTYLKLRFLKISPPCSVFLSIFLAFLLGLGGPVEVCSWMM